MKKKNKYRWISIEEKKPKKRDYIILCYYENKTCRFVRSFEINFFGKAIAWRRLEKEAFDSNLLFAYIHKIALMPCDICKHNLSRSGNGDYCSACLVRKS